MAARRTAGTSFDRYEIEALIARGAMATVHRARDRQSGEVVALKVPHPRYDGDPVFQERFRREQAIGLRLSHPGIVRVLAASPPNRPYLVMELAPGECLRDRLRREGPLPIATALDIARRIADVLVYLHEERVIHRDLKPEHVMLLPDGGVKLLDFGIAIEADRGDVAARGLARGLGTPGYIAPEQARGDRGDARSDIYALGCMIYEMLTASIPCATDEAGAVGAGSTEPPLPPRALRPEVPAELDELVRSMLEREPSRRPENALEVREKLLHPSSVLPAERPRTGDSRLPPALRVALGIAGLATLWLAFGWIAAWSGPAR